MNSRRPTLVTTLGLAALLGIGGLGPAHAEGGPPTITSVTPNPVAVDGTLTVTGTGCAAASPVSIRIFPTMGGPQPIELDSDNSGWVADELGDFSRGVDLASQFSAGAELGVVASCTATFDEAQMSDPNAASFVQVALTTPVVDVTVAATASYAARPTVTVTTTDAPGTLNVTLDGNPTPIYTSTTGPLAHTFRLPASLAVRSHTVQAVFDPVSGGAPTVTDTAGIVITKATSRVGLSRTTTAKARVGTRVKMTVTLASAGPRTGTVVIKDGTVARLTFAMRPADNGRRIVYVTLPRTGIRKLTARYAGSSSVLPATSRILSVTVVR
ncbi:MAG: Ig-like domain repeat protein [Propionibacteriales bacterium]|nr:Ig-like domain repeat protein [Propionibacteriales bacterium]